MSDLRKGTPLGGHCDGYFGDSHGPRWVEAAGPDWIVCRDENGKLTLATFKSPWSMGKKVREWLQETEATVQV